MRCSSTLTNPTNGLLSSHEIKKEARKSGECAEALLLGVVFLVFVVDDCEVRVNGFAVCLAAAAGRFGGITTGGLLGAVLGLRLRLLLGGGGGIHGFCHLVHGLVDLLHTRLHGGYVVLLDGGLEFDHRRLDRGLVFV